MSFATFMIENGYYILYIIFSITMIITMIFADVKKNKDAKAKEKIATNNVGLLDLYAKIQPLVIKAEEMYGRGKGSFKLDYVLTQLQLEAMKNNVQVDENTLIDKINAVVKTTKKVNAYEPTIEEQPTLNESEVK